MFYKAIITPLGVGKTRLCTSNCSPILCLLSLPKSLCLCETVSSPRCLCLRMSLDRSLHNEIERPRCFGPALFHSEFMRYVVPNRMFSPNQHIIPTTLARVLSAALSKSTPFIVSQVCSAPSTFSCVSESLCTCRYPIFRSCNGSPTRAPRVLASASVFAALYRS